jgi:chorismate--pyruvate lyase
MQIKISDRYWRRRPVGADAAMRRWLLDRGSLTRRIQTRSRLFSVELLTVTRKQATRDEWRLIETGSRRPVAMREVVLHSDSVPVVFAHSVAARRALKGPWRLLLTLGARPLGAALFADPRVARGPLCYRQIRQGHELYALSGARSGSAPARFWARRSLFSFRGSYLLVTEVFLPAILALAP